MEHKTQNVICQNCQNDFTIEPEDFSFYEKIKVPPPTWCIDCRQMRRYAWRNERTLYRRSCDLCKKSTVSIYSENKPFKVYCPTCWWGDGWDAKEFAIDFNFSRPFFEQWQELQLKIPRIALLTKTSINSDYTNHCGDNKDVYLSFATFYSERVLYSANLWKNSKDCVDCYLIPEKGELSYECIECESIYGCDFCIMVRDSMDCKYSYDLRNCSNCFLSYNLRNQSYCILNQKYSREEYFKKLNEYKLNTYSGRSKTKDLFLQVVSDKAIHPAAIIEKSIDSNGNFLFNCRNVEDSFDIVENENTKYGIMTTGTKDAMDTYHAGFTSELYYEVHGAARSSGVFFSHLCYDNTFIQYCDSCHNSQNLFGCIGIKKGSYMIFNKQYTKEEYEVLKSKIINHMKSTYEYGEFFPSKYSPIGYNETQGAVYMPLTKEEAVGMGMNWEDNMPGTFGKETISLEDIPDNISEVSDSVTKQILRCENCTKNYNIVPMELQFYKSRVIPIPHKCPDCRYKERLALRPPRKLWHRQCMCDQENHSTHSTHSGHCTIEFETTYAPDKSEIVYCEKCYQKEVY